MQPEHIVAEFEPGVAAHNHVHGAGHCAEMDSFASCAALPVDQVAPQCLSQELPGTLAIAAGLHPGVHDVAERRPMGGARTVEFHRAHDCLRRKRVPHLLQEVAQLFSREQVEQHEYVGLFCEPVVVRAVPFGVEDQIQAANGTVPGPVRVPVELREILIALELTDDAVAVEAHSQPTTDLIPPVDLTRSQSEPIPERTAIACFEQRHRLDRTAQHPRGHDIGVGIVPKPLPGRAGVPVMELVRAHHATDIVTVGRLVVAGQAGEKSCDFEQQLGALMDEEFRVTGGLVVLPYAVGDGEANMPLMMGIVGHPLFIAHVVKLGRSLFAALNTALPREHRAFEAGGSCGHPRFVQASVSITEQSTAQIGSSEGENRIDENLIPEHVPAVTLAMQAASGHACVQVGVDGSHRLQNMEGVQIERERLAFARAHVHGELIPQELPRPLVLSQKLCGVTQPPNPGRHRIQRRGDGTVAGGADIDKLLHPDRMPRLKRQLEFMSDPSCVLGEKSPARSKTLAAAVRPGACGHRDMDAGLICFHFQQ